MIKRFIIGATVEGGARTGLLQACRLPTGARRLTRNLWITTIYGALLGVSER
jgi:hypothetical protein